MATIGNTFVDLIDIYKGEDGKGAETSLMIEMLRAHTPILEDAVAVECNMGTKHRHKIRTGLPTSSWGRLYKGIPQSKSQYQQVDDTTGFIEGRSSIDSRELKLNPGREDAIRMREADGQMQGMSNSMGSYIFYEDTATNPDGFKGLASRYNTIGTTGASHQVIDAAGAGSDNTSIWFVTWGEAYTHLIYPSGMQAGLVREDKGEQRVNDDNGDPYYVKEELFSWHNGVAVANWQRNARIANIDVSEMLAGNVDLYSYMRKAYYRGRFDSFRRSGGADTGIPPVRAAIYCNADVLEALDALGTNAGASDNFVRLRPMEIDGQEVLTYRGIPLRLTDSLLNTEAEVV
ncbi:hypothetical protein IWC96_14430 [Brevundimonas sp. BAL450]|uniref:major capsid protein n=1 Tax=Brevundimonas sp. BAL450 TaxID=1708162 RepID=UPI0018C9FC42|nr:hypothetical protein [Brevundimonas sp. BAL450]MBG7616471.1 hypothetical protein [Brevundimonas sp. BAL450]